MKLRSSLALTLIEFLLAMTIFATIAVSLYATFFSGIQISKKAKHFEAFYRNIRFTVDTMQYDLENMVLFQFDLNPPVYAFSGDSESFTLIVPTESGIKKVSYFLDDPKNVRIHTVQLGMHTAKNVAIQANESSHQIPVSVLIRQEQSWGHEPDNEILNKQILKDSLKISYASWEEENLVWNNEWKNALFPLGVRIQMTFADPSDDKNKVQIDKIIYIPWGST